jgi:thymidylate synthase
MKQYHDLIEYILKHGERRTDRTGTGTFGVFGYQMRFDLSEGFPIVTTKKVHFKSVAAELLWMLRGETNIRPLVLDGVRIWNEWPYEKYKKSRWYEGESLEEFVEKIKNDINFAGYHGDLGPVYGAQWRNFNGIDQIEYIINELKENPTSRRILVNSWNPPELDEMALPPCHMMFQFYVQNGKLSLQLYQRSADVFLGVPFNISSYALLTHIIAREVGLKVGEFVHTLGDAHIYVDHIEQVRTQIEREPHSLPTLEFDYKYFEDYTWEDFKLIGYQHHPHIAGKVSV